MTEAAHRIIQVAVGVVVRADGAVLIGQRLAGKPYAGWWEFPGGKFERGEDAAQALARELDEELGIVVRRSEPWVVREHVYAHGHVRLHFRRVVDWTGEVRSREGQAFVWQQPAAVEVGPLLPAALAPIEWMQLPPLYALSHAAGFAGDTIEERIAGWLGALDVRLADPSPLRLLQLREPELDPPTFARLFDAVLARLAGRAVRLLVNSRHPAEYWNEASRQTGGGVHLTTRDLLLAAARDRADRVPGEPGTEAPHPGRPQVQRVAASCHQASDLAAAGRLGVDLAVCSPVASTRSHPGAAVLGWEGFAEAVARTPVPTYALGGLQCADLTVARSHGAHGIAMQRGVW